MKLRAYCLSTSILVISALAMLWFAGTTIIAGARQDGRRPRASASSARTGLLEAKKRPAQEKYANLPLNFEANAGQADERVKFMARGRGYKLFLTPSEAVLAVRRPSSPQSSASPSDGPLASVAAAARWSQSVLRFEMAGGNSSARMEPQDRLPGITNYFIGNDPAKWRTHIPNFAKVLYRDVYPGINAVYYGKEGRLETDFVVAPGKDPGVIRMRITGAEGMEVNTAGELVLSVAGGDVRLAKPVLYQEVDGSRKEVSGGYRLLSKNEAGFAVGSYDRGLPLVIDPTLVYSTYLGGTDVMFGDQVTGIAVDSAGEAYVTGPASSTDFPVKNPKQATLGGTENAFVTKFAANGTSLIFSTYLGGSSFDHGTGIAVDAAGNAYITGRATSINFPTTRAPGLNGTADAFVAKLSADGATLMYSFYLGGESNDDANAIAVDGNGNAYVTGFTDSMMFPVFPSAATVFQGTLAGSQNAFVAKVAANGTITWATYLGGNNSDEGKAIAVDPTGNVYIAGITDSTTFPLKNPVQGTKGGSAFNGNDFVTEINPTGTALVYSTFLGGSSNDDVGGIAVDSLGNTIVSGDAFSPDFPVLNSIQAHDPSAEDIFVAKYAPGGATQVFCTLFGDDSGGTHASAVALDTSNNIYVTGMTSALLLPTENPLQGTTASFNAGTFIFYNGSAFVVEFKSDGSDYLFSTFLGGSTNIFAPQDSNFSDLGSGIAVDATGNIYVGGTAGTTDFPTVNPFQASMKVFTTNGFVAKIAPTTPTSPQVFPISLTLATGALGTTSQPSLVTIANGTNTLTLTGMTFTGANPADFSETDSCGAQLLPQVVCTIAVSVTPSATGTRTATLNIGGVAQTVSITAMGVPATPPPQPGSIMVSPASLTFGNQELSTGSAPQFLTFTNTGTVATGVPGIMNGGANPSDFFASFQGTCSGPLAPGASCTQAVEFHPQGVGNRSATLTFTGRLTATPPSVGVSGTGTAMIASLTPGSLLFGNQVVPTTSAPQTLTLTNTSATVTLTNIVAKVSPTTTGFALMTNNCGSSQAPGMLAPGANCTMIVTFTPPTAQREFASVVVTDSDPAFQFAFLSGTGLNPAATLATINPALIPFGRQNLGMSSMSQSAFLENFGNTALVFTATPAGTGAGDFSTSDTCSGSIPAGGSCFLDVVFTPTVVGARDATVTINSSTTGVSGVPQMLTLTGTGINATTASLSPGALTFANQVIGSTSAPMLVTFANNGPKPLISTSGIISGTNSGDFSFTTPFDPSTIGCSGFFGGRYNPQVACPVAFTFTPRGLGTRTATFTVVDSTSNSPHTVTLMGPGVNGAAAAFSPNPVVFPPQSVGVTTSPMTLTLSNPGNQTLNLTTVTLGGTNQADFAILAASTTCINGATVLAGQSCVVNITFDPSVASGETATLTFVDNASPATQVVTITGVGATATGTADFTLSAMPSTLTVNAGTGATDNVTVSPLGGFTGIVTLALSALPAGANGVFTPPTITGGSGVSSLGITTSNTTPPGSYPLTITGTSGNLSHSAIVTLVVNGPAVNMQSNLGFSTVAAGTSSMMTFPLMNSGNAPLTFPATGAFAVTGPNMNDFVVTGNTCLPGPLVGGATCMITVTFTPAPAGISENATLTVTDNATNSPQVVNLNGSGAVVTASLTPAAGLNFGSVPQGMASEPMDAHLSASVNIGLNVSNIAVMGPNAADFKVQTNNCQPSVGAESSCRIPIVFTPSVGGGTTENATLVVTDNAAPAPSMQSITLTGVGTTGSTSFTFAPAPGSGTQATIIPGNTAQFTIVLNPSPGSSGPVSFSCLETPPTTTIICSVSPSSATLNGSTPITLVVTMLTNCVAALPPRGPMDMPPTVPPHVFVLWMLSLLGLAAVRRFAPETRLARVAPAVVMLMLTMTWAGCGAASVSNVKGAPTTPAGLYTLIIKATSGAAAQTIQLLVRVT